MYVKLSRGFDLPGSRLDAAAVIERAPATPTVAQLGADYAGLKPALAVSVGDSVAAGQVLFTQRGTPGLVFVAPGSGRVTAIHRGERRSLLSVVIELDDPDTVERPQVRNSPPCRFDADGWRQALLQSGLWSALRTRPFDRVPAPQAQPRTLFVTACDTHPYAPDPGLIIKPRMEDFLNGLDALARLQPERLYLCTSASAGLEFPDQPGFEHVRFHGPHPAGCAGTHIHLLDRQVSPAADTWHVGYQDVLAIGRFHRTGELDFERVITVGGPAPLSLRLLRTRLGTALAPLLDDNCRNAGQVLSGSPLGGRPVTAATAYLGRYHRQVTVVPAPASEPWWKSLLRDLGGHPHPFGRAANGTRGALPTGMLPLEAFDAVWPMPVPAAALLRALLCGDAETAVSLGALALAPEDLALCEHVCPAGQRYGQALSDVLADLERDL